MKRLHAWLATILLAFPAQAQDAAFRQITRSESATYLVTSIVFYFNGEDCFGAERSNSNTQRVVVRTRVFLDLYYEGALVATLNSAGRELIRTYVPEGHELSREQSRITLAKNGKSVRTWEIRDGRIHLAELQAPGKPLAEKPGPDENRYKGIFHPAAVLKAPTRQEAEQGMQRLSEADLADQRQ